MDNKKELKKYLIWMDFGLDGWAIIDSSDSLTRARELLKKPRLVTPDANVLLTKNITGKKRTAKRG